jgi:sugar fermentation stimulation protein A
MKFARPLIEGRLIRRYKRFLADVELADGKVITVHSPNTGSMKGCSTPGSRVWLQDSENGKRKYRHGWEIVEAEPGVLVGINTGLANGLVRDGIESGLIGELSGYSRIRQEVRYGQENSRIDLLLEREAGLAYVEVKSVTLVEQGVAYFPDAVSVRGAKHLRELAVMVREGHRAVIFYCVQRGYGVEVRPADAIDPEYGRALRQALAAGVEAVAYAADVHPAGIELQRSLRVVCP